MRSVRRREDWSNGQVGTSVSQVGQIAHPPTLAQSGLSHNLRLVAHRTARCRMTRQVVCRCRHQLRLRVQSSTERGAHLSAQSASVDVHVWLHRMSLHCAALGRRSVAIAASRPSQTRSGEGLSAHWLARRVDRQPAGATRQQQLNAVGVASAARVRSACSSCSAMPCLVRRERPRRRGADGCGCGCDSGLLHFRCPDVAVTADRIALHWTGILVPLSWYGCCTRLGGRSQWLLVRPVCFLLPSPSTRRDAMRRCCRCVHTELAKQASTLQLAASETDGAVRCTPSLLHCDARRSTRPQLRLPLRRSSTRPHRRCAER